METFSNWTIAGLLLPLALVAFVGVISPATLAHRMGGPRDRKARMLETFLRIAGTLLLIGALITWHRLLERR